MVKGCSDPWLSLPTMRARGINTRQTIGNRDETGPPESGTEPCLYSLLLGYHGHGCGS